MKYHTQEHLYVPGLSQRGSCYPTVIACILDLELHEVPYFHLFYWDKKNDDNFLIELNRHYLNNRNLDDPLNETYQKDNWHRQLSLYHMMWVNIKDIWLQANGYTENWIWDNDINEWLKKHPDTPYIGHGTSPRNIGHVVVYMNGKMIHDPHPSRGGIILGKGSTYTWLKPIERPIYPEQLVIC